MSRGVAWDQAYEHSLQRVPIRTARDPRCFQRVLQVACFLGYLPRSQTSCETRRVVGVRFRRVSLARVEDDVIRREPATTGASNYQVGCHRQ